MRDNKECCPYCNADFQGEPIPKESQKVYGSARAEPYTFCDSFGIGSP